MTVAVHWLSEPFHSGGRTRIAARTGWLAAQRLADGSELQQRSLCGGKEIFGELVEGGVEWGVCLCWPASMEAEVSMAEVSMGRTEEVVG